MQLVDCVFSDGETSDSDFVSETTVPSTVSIILDSQPCCCEFTKSHDLLVVGTYNLVTEPEGVKQPTKEDMETPVQERTGSLLVLHIMKQEARLLQTKILPHAILDLHFSPVDHSTFAAATSVGTVCFFSIDYEHDGALTLVKTIRVWDSSKMALSLAYQIWDGCPQIAVAGSTGEIAVFPDRYNENDVVDHIPAHGFEAWTIALPRRTLRVGSDNNSAKFLYSGGDDSELVMHELGTPNRQSRSRRSHFAGVTAIVVLPVIEETENVELLITGSYDNFIRVMIPPSFGGTADCLVEKNVGGGVFRISRLYLEDVVENGVDLRFNVLASCMHAGAKVVQIRRIAGAWSIEVIAKCTEHKSMVYGGDARASEEGHLLVSTSFYDRRLCVWSLPH